MLIQISDQMAQDLLKNGEKVVSASRIIDVGALDLHTIRKKQGTFFLRKEILVEIDRKRAMSLYFSGKKVFAAMTLTAGDGCYYFLPAKELVRHLYENCRKTMEEIEKETPLSLSDVSRIIEMLNLGESRYVNCKIPHKGSASVKVCSLNLK